jgi:hypothetical protein
MDLHGLSHPYIHCLTILYKHTYIYDYIIQTINIESNLGLYIYIYKYKLYDTCTLKTILLLNCEANVYLYERVYKAHTTNKESYLTMQLSKRMVFNAMQA